MELFYRKLGAGSPLIILHGLFGSSDNWLSISKLFATDYEVFLIDQRNHGQSPHLGTHTYHDMAMDLHNWIISNKIENPIIIGHSMGGKTAMKYAQLFGQSIKKLIIVDIAPKYYAPHHDREINALKSIHLATIASRQEADDTMAKFIPELEIRQFLLKNLYRTQTGDFQWRMNLQVLIQNIENIIAATDNFVTPVPTLFIKGENSDYITTEDEKLIAKTFPNYSLKTIENAGHWVQAEQPIAFRDAVIAFLNS